MGSAQRRTRHRESAQPCAAQVMSPPISLVRSRGADLCALHEVRGPPGRLSCENFPEFVAMLRGLQQPWRGLPRCRVGGAKECVHVPSSGFHLAGRPRRHACSTSRRAVAQPRSCDSASSGHPGPYRAFACLARPWSSARCSGSASSRDATCSRFCCSAAILEEIVGKEHPGVAECQSLTDSSVPQQLLARRCEQLGQHLLRSRLLPKGGRAFRAGICGARALRLSKPSCVRRLWPS